MKQDKTILILITVPNQKTGEEIASHLVEKNIAACVNIIPGLTSIYKWKGKIEKDDELLLLVKTQQELFHSVEKSVLEIHPYEVPEIISIDISQGFTKYLDWILSETNIS